MSKIKTKEIVKGTIKTLDKSTIRLNDVKEFNIKTKNVVDNYLNDDKLNTNEYSTQTFENFSDRIIDKNFDFVMQKGKKSAVNTKENLTFIKNKTKNFKNQTKVKLRNNKIKRKIKDYNNLSLINANLTKKKKNKLKLEKIRQKATKETKNVIKATVSTIKSIINGTKALFDLLLAGGWIILVIIILICLIGMLCSSIFGIFFSSENTGSIITMNEVITEINNDMATRIKNIQNFNIHDEYFLEIDKADWNEILSIYTAKMTKGINKAEVITIDEIKKQEIKKVFWDMHQILFEVKQEASDNYMDKKLEKNLYIKITSKSVEEMMKLYNFSQIQIQQVNELLNSKYSSMWSSVIYGTPVGSPDMVKIALSQIGNVGGQPYWEWYGFKNRVGWCAIFVSWVAEQAGYIEKNIMPKFSYVPNGVSWFKAMDRWQDEKYIPNSGDIIFFDWESDGIVDHVGIVEKIENDFIYTIEGNSGDACKMRQYNINNNSIFGYGTILF